MAALEGKEDDMEIKLRREVKDSIIPKGEWYEVRRVRPGLHKHHIVFGDGLRPLSEKYGLYILSLIHI